MNPVLRSGLTLAAIAAVCTALVATTWQLSKARIEDNRRLYLEQSLSPALAGVDYNSRALDSQILIQTPHELPGSGAVLVYRVYKDGAAAAALFVVTARDGYSGPIRLLVGIRSDGTVSGLHVLEHRETPGLGDGIETDKSDWSQQFRGRSLGQPVADGWQIRADGGEFDQLTGASVTPRAVIKAVKQTLIYFEANRETIFSAPATEQDTQ